MLAFFTVALLGGLPNAAQAEVLASNRDWESLYLAFAGVSVKAYVPAERRRIAKALAAGCEASIEHDAVMAYSLGEKSVQFESDPRKVLCAARAAVKTDQRSAAEETLRQGLRRHPKDALLSLELGSLFIEEQDGASAVAVLSRVSKRSALAAKAERLLEKARALVRETSEGRARLEGNPGVTAKTPTDATDESAPAADAVLVGANHPKEWRSDSSSYESGVDEEGRRLRQNAFFRFRYFNAQRDFGQRADYEGRVQAALDEARTAAQRILGISRQRPVDVILYSKSEFSLHHGPWAASAIAGFYSQSAIRINDSAEMNARNQATLVHEYVHAVVDEVCQFDDRGVPTWLHEGLAEYVEWQYQGRSKPEGRYDTLLRQAAAQNSLPRLESLRRDPLVSGSDPGFLYAYAGLTVRAYVQRFGMANLVSLLRTLAKGESFERAFHSHTSSDLERFEETVRDEIRAR